MKKFTLLLLATILTATLVSCRKQDEKPTGVAVLDLARVASQLGWDQQFQKAVQERTESLDSQIQKMQTDFQAQIQQQAQTLGDGEQGEQQLQQMRQRAGQILQRAVNEAQQQSQQYRNEMITQFRDKIRPIAIQVANEKGFALVVLKTEQIYHHLPDTDITDEVITQAQSVDLKSLTAPEEATDQEGEAEQAAPEDDEETEAVQEDAAEN